MRNRRTESSACPQEMEPRRPESLPTRRMPPSQGTRSVGAAFPNPRREGLATEAEARPEKQGLPMSRPTGRASSSEARDALRPARGGKKNDSQPCTASPDQHEKTPNPPLALDYSATSRKQNRCAVSAAPEESGKSDPRQMPCSSRRRRWSSGFTTGSMRNRWYRESSIKRSAIACA